MQYFSDLFFWPKSLMRDGGHFLPLALLAPSGDRRAGARAPVNHLRLSLALPPQEVARRRRRKVKVEEGARRRGGDDGKGQS